jgi:hypothetical protein
MTRRSPAPNGDQMPDNARRRAPGCRVRRTNSSDYPMFRRSFSHRFSARRPAAPDIIAETHQPGTRGGSFRARSPERRRHLACGCAVSGSIDARESVRHGAARPF